MYDLCSVFMATWAGVYDEIDFNDTPSVEINIFFIFIHMDQFMIPRSVTRTEVVTSYRIKCREYNSHQNISFADY